MVICGWQAREIWVHRCADLKMATNKSTRCLMKEVESEKNK